MHMDSRIGILNSGKFYAFANGYDQPEIRGTLEEVEIALGLRDPASVIKAPATATVNHDDRYTVTLRFQHPAWDEVNGIVYDDISARTKAEAINIVRTKAFSDGHTGRGKGRYWFTAEIAD